MSRCGSCDLYHEREDNFGVTCDGDQPPEDCIYKLQSLIGQLRFQIPKKAKAASTAPTDESGKPK